MRRSILLTIAVLGAVLSLVGMTGVFAPFTDRAQIGTVTPNRIGSEARPREADLKVATFAPRSGCGTFADDLPDPIIDVTDMKGGQVEVRPMCVRNDGGQPVAITISLVDKADLEIDCTGDEAVVDLTCAPGEQGELGSFLFATVSTTSDVGCASTVFGQEIGFVNSSGLTGVGTLDPGEVGCFEISFLHIGGAFEVEAQSDEVTFKIQFDGITA